MGQKNFLTRTTEVSHFICQRQLADVVENKGYAVGLDATCGRGNDTLWLAGICRKVYGFDVQEVAIRDTRQLLYNNNFHSHVTEDFREKITGAEGIFLIKDSHEHIRSYVNEGIDVAVFNLGYLPGGSKEVTTQKETTLCALNAALELLNPGGIIAVTVYWGHDRGKEEREAIARWAGGLQTTVFHCLRMDMVNQSNFPPENFFITRKK